MTGSRLLICVVGPTGIGKTNLAIQLAKAFSTEVISSDSRQFYREMRIGTAVPSPKELAMVPHHFIHSHSIEENYSVGDFERDVIKLIHEKFYPENAEAAFKKLILAGGSGLYTDAVVKGLDHLPTSDPALRQKLSEKLENEGISSLQTILKKVDPEYYAVADIQNPHRVIRALEVYFLSGKPFSSYRNNFVQERKFKHCYIGLTAEREIIYDRINKRVDQMMASGLLEEAEKLYPFKHYSALQTVGYRELFEYFDGKWSLDFAVSEIKKNTRRFAKRQLTWYRKNPEVNWFDYQTDAKEIITFILNRYSGI